MKTSQDERGRFRSKSRPSRSKIDTNSAQPREPFTGVTLRAFREGFKERTGKKLSRQKLADALGVSVQSIEQYEYGQRPVPTYLDKLVAYFDRYGPIDG